MLSARCTEWSVGSSYSVEMFVKADVACAQLCEYGDLFSREFSCQSLESVRGHRGVDFAKTRCARVAAEMHFGLLLKDFSLFESNCRSAGRRLLEAPGQEGCGGGVAPCSSFRVFVDAFVLLNASMSGYPSN